ncbi:hypothetical protein D9619_011665 [Psilocybe cf. subviscida]|uniref:Uncharacterized protein n=1 Tax=Psilocybe cf. subviscida TaxID=2480587 RepID=A0A8H5BT79_9AGAR|nr:hypothetical protein D9619_011665 [Psilocybe cf. subviscida]
MATSVPSTGQTGVLNILLLEDHPVRHEVLDSFTPFGPPVEAPYLQTDLCYHEPVTVIASPGVGIKTIVGNATDFVYFSAEVEGVTLVLLQEASKEDTLDPNLLDDYINRCASSWCLHMNPYGDPYFGNDTSMIATDCDKARKWTTAALRT